MYAGFLMAQYQRVADLPFYSLKKTKAREVIHYYDLLQHAAKECPATFSALDSMYTLKWAYIRKWKDVDGGYKDPAAYRRPFLPCNSSSYIKWAAADARNFTHNSTVFLELCNAAFGLV